MAGNVGMAKRWIYGVVLATALAVPGWSAGTSSLKAAPPVQLNPKTVTAEKGPIRIVFQVANTKVREDDSLLVRLTLTNTGKRPMKVSAGAFWEVLTLAESRSLRIEVRETKTRRSVSRFKRMDILWTEELDSCIERFDNEHPSPEQPKVLVLKPGESIATPSKPPMATYALRFCEKDPEPKLLPPFGEIPGWIWSEPSYEIRAVYDDRLNPKFEKHLTEEGRRSREFMVLVETPWIPISRIP